METTVYRQQGDLLFAIPLAILEANRPSPLCHPEELTGLSASQGWNERAKRSAFWPRPSSKFVIVSPKQICHPDRSVPEFLFRHVRQIHVCGFH